MATALRPRWKLCEVLPVVGMAKSSCEYARSAQAKGETEGRVAARKAVIEAFEASGGTYGYRRAPAQVNADAGDGAAIGGRTVRDIMRDEGLVACAARKKRRCSSYEGEISEAPENLLRDERGGHRFRSNKPNELWITDVTEFRIPAGKAYLSPIVDCFDGMPPSWSISTTPDDARCEGFFGRLKIEFFHGCDWTGVTLGEFMDMLDAYLRWYRDVRIKGDLDYRSPMQYRRDLGLAA